mgnify:CR=1
MKKHKVVKLQCNAPSKDMTRCPKTVIKKTTDGFYFCKEHATFYTSDFSWDTSFK